MAFVTFWLAKDARKVLSNIVSDGHGTVFSVAYPKEKPQASTAPWVGEYEELKLYVVGLPNLTTDTEVPLLNLATKKRSSCDQALT